jgi:hypothetical protein
MKTLKSKILVALMFIPGWFLFLARGDAELVEGLVQKGLPRWLFWPVFLITAPFYLLFLALAFGIVGGFQWLKLKLGLTMTDEEFRQRWMQTYRRNSWIIAEDLQEEGERRNQPPRERAVSIYRPGCRECDGQAGVEECKRIGHDPCTHPFGCDCAVLAKGMAECNRCRDVVPEVQ